MKTFKILALAGVLVLPAFSSFAASTTAQALQAVVAAISIVKVTDLDFGSAPQGDVAKTVAPAAGANFTVSGAPNTAYTISFGAANINMITGVGGANETILVNNFISSPAVGANGMLSAGGSQTLRVGADRAALGAAQVVGSYAGTFTVNVIY